MPARGGRAVATNSVSRLAPRTISGVAIGRKMSPLSSAAAAELVAGEGQADHRPRIVAMTVDRTAIARLVVTASPRPGQSNGWAQPSSENSFQM